MLVPVFVLVLWTHGVLLWMFAIRLPAMRRAGIVLDANAPRGSQMATLPPKVRRKSDNYTHLTEHPTLFYATALGLAVLGSAGELEIGLAWAFVGLRMVHTAVQTTFNHIPVRFVLFALSALANMALVVRALVLAVGAP